MESVHLPRIQSSQHEKPCPVPPPVDGKIVAVRCHPNFRLHVLLRMAFKDEGLSENEDGAISSEEESNSTSMPASVLSSPPPSSGPQHPSDSHLFDEDGAISVSGTIPSPTRPTPPMPHLDSCASFSGAFPSHSIPLHSPKPQSNSHRRRARDRAAVKEKKGHAPRPSIKKKYLEQTRPIRSSFVVEKLSGAKGGYVAQIDTPTGAQKKYTIAELEGRGFTRIQWNGKAPRPIVDGEGRVFAVLVGQPACSTFSTSCANVLSLMVREGEGAQFLKKDKRHRRGHFPAVNVGVMHGKGTKHPINISTAPYSDVIQRLLDDPDVQRLATFSSAAFQQWFPNIFGYYKERLDRLWGEFNPPNGGSPLKKNFIRSIYTSAAFNFGPQVRTFKHRDYLNCPFGLCAVQALGNFDHTKGGHIVLWEAKIFAEFPANSVILIPSATITHSNLPCQPGETRISFTQYCAGGLFRYVDNGFRTDCQLKEEDLERYERNMKRRESQWEEGLALFSRLEELRSTT